MRKGEFRHAAAPQDERCCLTHERSAIDDKARQTPRVASENKAVVAIRENRERRALLNRERLVNRVARASNERKRFNRVGDRDRRGGVDHRVRSRTVVGPRGERAAFLSPQGRVRRPRAECLARPCVSLAAAGSVDDLNRADATACATGLHRAAHGERIA